MIGVGDVHAFHLPQQSRRRIAADHDLIIAVFGGDDPCKAGSHAQGIIDGCGIPLCFFYRKCSRADHAHLVERPVSFASRRYFHGLLDVYIDLHGNLQRRFLSAVDNNIVYLHIIISCIGDGELPGADGHAGDPKAAVGAGHD